MRWRYVATAAGLGITCWPILPSAAEHYTCKGDEVHGELMGEPGSICAPRCSEGSFDCPTDVPGGSTAQPQCMLQDVDKVPYCGLLCEADDQCPSGWTCQRTAALELGVCMRLLSFNEWASAGSRRRLDLGLPSKVSAKSHGFQVARAYQALMSLKAKKGIPDGDADMLVVEEMIAVAHARKADPSSLSHSLGLSGVLSKLRQHHGYANQNGGSEGHPEEWSTPGSLLWWAFWMALVYFLVGAVYNYHVKGARGADILPDIAIWKQYPELVYGVQQVATKAAGGREPQSLRSKGASTRDRGPFVEQEDAYF